MFRRRSSRKNKSRNNKEVVDTQRRNDDPISPRNGHEDESEQDHVIDSIHNLGVVDVHIPDTVDEDFGVASEDDIDGDVPEEIKYPTWENIEVEEEKQHDINQHDEYYEGTDNLYPAESTQEYRETWPKATDRSNHHTIHHITGQIQRDQRIQLSKETVDSESEYSEEERAYDDARSYDEYGNMIGSEYDSEEDIVDSKTNFKPKSFTTAKHGPVWNELGKLPREQYGTNQLSESAQATTPRKKLQRVVLDVQRLQRLAQPVVHKNPPPPEKKFQFKPKINEGFVWKPPKNFKSFDPTEFAKKRKAKVQRAARLRNTMTMY
eukprot:m.67553 g.67553  ORF g.67553 m.67553 type:complete len:321 (+) comp11899_c0_seq1:174-1136(+)